MNTSTNEKCNCFHLEKEITPPHYDCTTGRTTYGKISLIPQCYGTKEKELCTCGGDPSKCDFYKHKRKENKMEKEKLSTAEMWLRAQKDEKCYVSGCMLYNKFLGFVDRDYPNRKWNMNSFSSFEQFMNNLEWEEIQTSIISKEEAEKKLNAIIV